MSLALTFRPENFDDILGQYELIEIFKKFTALQKLPHSIFFWNSRFWKNNFC